MSHGGSCLTVTRDVNLTCPVVLENHAFQQTSEGPWAHSIKHHLPTTLSNELAALTATCLPSPLLVATQVYWVCDKTLLSHKMSKVTSSVPMTLQVLSTLCGTTF